MSRCKISFAVFTIVACVPTQAHHSFAVYDIDNKIQRTGVLTKFAFASPHIELELQVERADGRWENWNIESLSPRRWDRFGLPRDAARVGEPVTILGWPARNGDDAMLLSTLVTERGTLIVIDEVRQRRAREDLPEVTVKRQSRSCQER